MNHRVRQQINGPRRLAIEALMQSANVIKAAQKGGYLDDEGNRTKKQIKRASRSSRGGGKVKGFQSGIIEAERDLAEEISFWKSGAPETLAHVAGIGFKSRGDLLKRLTRTRGTYSKRRRKN